mmetsp:Transcript_2324/g.5222  ORF Transcript_2324/g.5222 Transcript_2324/m.5222 type:complete len:112 (+) Transcript_2324:170-505(+)
MHLVFWLFVPVDWFFPNNQDVLASDVVCLGLWYLDRISSTCDLNQCGNIGTDSEKFDGRYCEILFDDTDPNTMWAREEARGNFALARMLHNIDHPPPDHLFDGWKFNKEQF